MKLELIDDWQVVLKRAWSLKFTGLSLFFSAAEVYVQVMTPSGIDGGVFASLAGTVTLIAGVARLLAQKEIPHGSVPKE